MFCLSNLKKRSEADLLCTVLAGTAVGSAENNTESQFTLCLLGRDKNVSSKLDGRVDVQDCEDLEIIVITNNSSHNDVLELYEELSCRTGPQCVLKFIY